MIRFPLTRSDFRGALENGLGRAMIHARRYGLEGMEQEIQRALSRSLAYDAQIEYDRDEWLWRLLVAGRRKVRFRRFILDRLFGAQEYHSIRQLSHLAFRLAQRGDRDARRALYSVFYRLIDKDNHGIADEIIRLDGLNGLRRVAARVGGRLLKGEDEWSLNVEEIWRIARESFPRRKLIRALMAGRRAERTFLETALRIDAHWKRERRARHPDASRRRVSWADFEAALHSSGPSGVSPYVFSRDASDSELKLAFVALFQERNPKVISRMLQVFQRRRPPSWDARLFRFLRSKDPDVRRRAWSVISHFTDPEIRRLAEKAVSDPRAVSEGALCLFERSYRGGDAVRLMRALKMVGADVESRHSAGSIVASISEVNRDKDLLPVIIRAYETTPCSHCRKRIFERMRRWRVLPTWIVEECLYDCCAETRKDARAARR